MFKIWIHFQILCILSRLLDTLLYEVLLILGVFSGIHGELDMFDKLEACLWLMAYQLYFPIDCFLVDKEYLRNFDRFVVVMENILISEETQTIFQKQVNNKLNRKCWRFIPLHL